MRHMKNVSETRPLPGMTKEEWDRVRVSKSAAELKAMGCVVESEFECCSDEKGCCSDHDEDCKTVQRIRGKALKEKLTAKDIEDHNVAEIRAKAKGLL